MSLVNDFVRNILEWLNFLNLIPIEISKRVIASLLPIGELNNSFYDNLMLLMKKMLHSKEPNAKQCALSSYCRLLFTETASKQEKSNEISSAISSALHFPLSHKKVFYSCLLSELPPLPPPNLGKFLCKPSQEELPSFNDQGVFIFEKLVQILEKYIDVSEKKVLVELTYEKIISNTSLDQVESVYFQPKESLSHLLSSVLRFSNLAFQSQQLRNKGNLFHVLERAKKLVLNLVEILLAHKNKLVIKVRGFKFSHKVNEENKRALQELFVLLPLLTQVIDYFARTEKMDERQLSEFVLANKEIEGKKKRATNDHSNRPKTREKQKPVDSEDTNKKKEKLLEELERENEKLMEEMRMSKVAKSKEPSFSYSSDMADDFLECFNGTLIAIQLFENKQRLLNSLKASKLASKRKREEGMEEEENESFLCDNYEWKQDLLPIETLAHFLHFLITQEDVQFQPFHSFSSQLLEHLKAELEKSKQEPSLSKPSFLPAKALQQLLAFLLFLFANLQCTREQMEANQFFVGCKENCLQGMHIVCKLLSAREDLKEEIKYTRIDLGERNSGKEMQGENEMEVISLSKLLSYLSKQMHAEFRKGLVVSLASRFVELIGFLCKCTQRQISRETCDIFESILCQFKLTPLVLRPLLSLFLQSLKIKKGVSLAYEMVFVASREGKKQASELELETNANQFKIYSKTLLLTTIKACMSYFEKILSIVSKKNGFNGEDFSEVFKFLLKMCSILLENNFKDSTQVPMTSLLCRMFYSCSFLYEQTYKRIKKRGAGLSEEVSKKFLKASLMLVPSIVKRMGEFRKKSEVKVKRMEELFYRIECLRSQVREIEDAAFFGKVLAESQVKQKEEEEEVNESEKEEVKKRKREESRRQKEKRVLKKSKMPVFRSRNNFVDAALGEQSEVDNFADLEDWIVCKPGKNY